MCPMSRAKCGGRRGWGPFFRLWRPGRADFPVLVVTAGTDEVETPVD